MMTSYRHCLGLPFRCAPLLLLATASFGGTLHTSTTPHPTLAADASDLIAAADEPVASASQEQEWQAWEFLSEEDEVKTFSRHNPETDLVEFKGEAFVPASLASVLSVLADAPRRPQWVNRLVEARDLKDISSLERIEYNHTAAPWPAKDRDFVFRARILPNVPERSAQIIMESIEDQELMPEQSCCVRGSLHHSLYSLKETVSHGVPGTSISVEISVDPKGMIPTFLVKLIQKSWPRRTLLGLRKQLESLKSESNPQYAGNAYHQLFDPTPMPQPLRPMPIDQVSGARKSLRYR